MDEQTPFITVKRLACVSAVAILLLAAAVGWLAYRVENLSADQFMTNANLSAYKLLQERQQTNHTVDWNTVVKSGKGGFQVRLPGGWGPVVNDMKSDFVIMMGMAQPTLTRGGKVTVTETQGFGTDAPSLFSIMLLNKGEVAPPDTRGTAEEFSIGKAEEEIKGTKYTYIYPQDVFVDGIGGRHFQGDRDYEYVLPVGDKELRVYYHVYGSDPRNLIETVDEIVRTVTLGKTSPADL